MRYLNPLAIMFMSLLLSADPAIGVGPVLFFLAGLILTFLPPALPGTVLRNGLFLLFCVVPIVVPPFLPYLAPAVYWQAYAGKQPYVLAAAIPAFLAGFATSESPALPALGLCLVAFMFGRTAGNLTETTLEAHDEMDRERAKRLQVQAEKETKAREAEQDIRLATLAERNRIARDLHDTIGHVLSSALLQTTAALTVGDAATKDEGLKDIQATLKRGMEKTRDSVHGLYEQSLSFERELKEMTDRFTHCAIASQIRFDTEPPHDYRQTMLKTVAEALTNVVRHSNATLVAVTAEEHPGFYRLKIKDNGTRIETAAGGIHLGIDTMKRRAMRHGGSLRIETNGGFGLILMLPKQSAAE